MKKSYIIPAVAQEAFCVAGPLMNLTSSEVDNTGTSGMSGAAPGRLIPGNIIKP